MPPPAWPPAPRPSGLDRLGPRVDRRPEPRLGTALAGAGVALVVLGAVAVGGDNAGGGGAGSRLPGILLSLAVVLAGYGLSVRWRSGALGAAAVAASALALPVLMGFLTLDNDRVPPLQFDTILLVSTLVWATSYVFSPARGHCLYLSAALIGVWLWLLEASEGLLSYPFRATGSLFRLSTGDGEFGGPFFGSARTAPDPHTVGSITLVLAVVSLVASAVLDRKGRAGMATPFVFVGVVQLAIGVALYADDLKQPGEGLAAVVLGLVVVWMGATAGRRLTTWTGAAAVWLGLVLLIDEVVGDSATGVGVAAMVSGVALVAVAHFVSTAWREPDEVVPGPSRFSYSGGSTQPWGPPPPPAGSVLG
ncbi:MAG TPA: hypothetical protein VHI95_03200 [Acidimicrobiales bacterium]|nr:hypothetical protein [Acidimicrobiales bacterium]